MNPSRHRCKICGHFLLLSRDEQDQVDGGWMPAPDVCDDCGEVVDEKPKPEPDETSDADPGL
jgi:rRNA maturation endonuclease Nob1